VRGTAWSFDIIPEYDSQFVVKRLQGRQLRLALPGEWSGERKLKIDKVVSKMVSMGEKVKKVGQCGGEVTSKWCLSGYEEKVGRVPHRVNSYLTDIDRTQGGSGNIVSALI